MKKTFALVSLCIPAIALANKPCEPEPYPEKEMLRVETCIEISKDTPEEVKRAIRIEAEEDCRDMKEKYSILEGVCVESKCLECGCGTDQPHPDKVKEAPAPDKACPCDSKPKPKK